MKELHNFILFYTKINFQFYICELFSMVIGGICINYTRHILLIHSFVNGHNYGYFCIFGYCEKMAKNMRQQLPLRSDDFISYGYKASRLTAALYDQVISSFKETSILFSLMAMPIHILSKLSFGFLFLQHSLCANIVIPCLSDKSFMGVWSYLTFCIFLNISHVKYLSTYLICVGYFYIFIREISVPVS